MQSRAIAGESYMGMGQVFRAVYAQYGMAGLFSGVVPRIGLNIWQTLFMVTGAQLVRDAMSERKS